MGKNREVWSCSTYHRYIKEGRGQGEGINYKPWLTTHNVPSNGINTRILGRKTGRIHHYFSRNEYHYHLLLENNPEVTDIREQYPLTLKETLKIAQQLDIRHPIVNQFPFVLTCDFLVTANGEYYARTVKMASELSKPRVLDKFRIEATFWKKMGIDFKIVTEREINVTKADNLSWLYSGESFVNLLKAPESRLQATHMFLNLYNSDIPFHVCLSTVESHFLRANS